MPAARSGFTLVELLIVVLIIGILAAIGVPKFAASRDRALLATMKADLRNLITAQEAYHNDQGAYYGGAVPSPVLFFQPSTAVSVTLSGAIPNGYQATAVHSQTTRSCVIFVGQAAPLAPATSEGVPACS